MKNYAGLSAAIILSVVLTASCAITDLTPGIPSGTESANLPVNDVQHTVSPGDRLSDISLKYTGRVDQWQTIATHNNITDPRTLRIGDVITIPASMIPGQDNQSSGSGNDNSSRNASSSDQKQMSAPKKTAGEQRAKEAQTSNNGAPDVHLAPVNANRTFKLNPIESSNLATSDRYGTKPPRVRVIGTYYPKGIYQQPASYSKLLMRVTPGTIFELDQVVNDWYKVNTDKGIGYMRAEDGNVIPDQ